MIIIETLYQHIRKSNGLALIMDNSGTLERPNTFSFSSEICNVSKIENFINEVFAEAGISEDHYGKVLVALTEAVNNAILHGNSSDPCKMVQVSYTPTEQILYFNVKDEGTGFNPEVLPDPTDPEYIDKPNGRGVFLMKRLADSIEFLHEGNEVKLGFVIAN